MTEVLTCALTGLLFFLLKEKCAIVFLAQGATTSCLCGKISQGAFYI